MNVNIVMLSLNRPALLYQALRSLFMTPQLPHPWRLTIIDDCSNDPQTIKTLEWAATYPDVAVFYNKERMGVGASRNKAIDMLIQKESELLYLSDNDVFFTQGWLDILVTAYRCYGDQVKVIGGYCHPFNQEIVKLGHYFIKNGDNFRMSIRDAIDGLSWLIDWDTFKKWGPFDDNSIGCGKSEDWAFCQRVRGDGFEVGVVEPMPIINCGMTNSDGVAIPGADIARPQVDGLVIE